MRIADLPKKNPAAYDLFLKGKYFFNQLQTSSMKDPVANGRAAAAAFGGAIAADPNFALAYALRSSFERYLQWYGVDRRGEVLAAAQSDAERALALQPELGEAHIAMGYVH